MMMVMTTMLDDGDNDNDNETSTRTPMARQFKDYLLHPLSVASLRSVVQQAPSVCQIFATCQIACPPSLCLPLSPSPSLCLPPSPSLSLPLPPSPSFSLSIPLYPSLSLAIPLSPSLSLSPSFPISLYLALYLSSISLTRSTSCSLSRSLS